MGSGAARMIEAADFGALLRAHSFDFFSGVPCSFLKSMINYASNELNYVSAANEGEAVAIAAGASLGNKRAGVLLQNSGLTNALAPLTSLNYIFRIPVLGLVSLRGEPGASDEPQHELLGKITQNILETCEIKTFILSQTMGEIKEQLQSAERYWKENRSVFFIVRKGTFADEKLVKGLSFQQYKRERIISSKPKTLPKRGEVLELLNSMKDKDTVLLATTGKTGRELFEVENSPQHFYMVGSMGCVSSVGLGLALSRPDKKIIAIDGDGSLLMRMGSLATNGFYKPENFLHILLDNQCHDSTGGQETVSPNISFTGIASSSGYPLSIEVHDLQEFKESVSLWQKNGGLTFLHLAIGKGSKAGLGRPTITPCQVKERLIEFLNQ